MDDIIVYTCITNGYDKLKPLKWEDGVKYVCFSDGTVNPIGKWEMRPIDRWRNYKNARLTARYYKTHPHILFPDHKWSVWIDGSITPKISLRNIITELDKNGDIFSASSHCYSTFSKEFEEILIARYEDENIIRDIVKRYNKEKVPNNIGLHTTNKLIRLNVDIIKTFNEQWWDEIKRNSIRDQVSFDYVRWKLGIKIAELNNNYFLWNNKHDSRRIRYWEQEKKMRDALKSNSSSN